MIERTSNIEKSQLFDMIYDKIEESQLFDICNYIIDNSLGNPSKRMFLYQ